MAGGWRDILRRALGWLDTNPSVTVTPAAVALVWVVPAPTVTGAATVTPAAVALVWTIPLPEFPMPVVVTPAAVALAWAVPLPQAGDILDVNQKILGGSPIVTLDVGGETLDDYLINYTYRETAGSDGSLSIFLDNRDGNFDDLATDFPLLVRGAAVDLRRGLRISDTITATKKLPRCWVEAMEYVGGDDGEGMLLLECLDWRGLLGVLSYETETSFSSQTVQVIATSVLGVAGLTVASGSFTTSLTIDHVASPFDTLEEVVNDLMGKVKDELYVGLDAEIQYKNLAPAEAAGYDYDWNVFDGTAHPLLEGTQLVENSPVFNKVTVIGGPELQYSGSAEDTTETTLTGQTRNKYIEDKSLGSDAECATRATAELQFFQSQAVSATVVARPHFSLRMYDMVSVGAPFWGGATLAAGRVTQITERYGLEEWEQEIELGDIPENILSATEGILPGSRKRKKRKRGRGRGRSKKRSGGQRKSSRYRRKVRSSSGSGRRGSSRSPSYRGHVHPSDQVLGTVPIGAIIMWSGVATPAGWALCDGGSGTPDLRDRFVLAAGPTYAAGSTGGLAEIDIQHSHTDGTLATDSDSHSHGVTGSTAGDSHSHGNGTLATDSDSHSHTYFSTAGGTRPDQGVEVSRLALNSDNHSHNVTGSTASDSHSHTDGTLATDSDGHSHDVTGATANALSATQEVLPPYYAIAFIMRIL